MGECSKLHNEGLHNLYSFPDIVRQIKSKVNGVSGACVMHRTEQKSVRGFGRKAQRKEASWMTDA
jgi:hypothetical protein